MNFYKIVSLTVLIGLVFVCHGYTAQDVSKTVLTEKIYPAENFKISFPDAWEKHWKFVGGIKHYTAWDQTDNPAVEPGAVVVYFQDLGNTMFNLDARFEEYLRSISYFRGMSEIIGQGDTKVDGYAAKWVNFRQNVDGKALVNLSYIVVADNYQYVILFSASPEPFEEKRKLFDKILKTFHYIKPKIENDNAS